MAKYNKVKDSGKRRNFGKNRAVRDVATGKGRYDLISPIAMQRLADHYENGAGKYKDKLCRIKTSYGRSHGGSFRKGSRFLYVL